MNVTRVFTTTGSRPEPPFSDQWDRLTQLQWHAGLATHDGDIPITVARSTFRQGWLRRTRRVRGRYDVRVGKSVTGPMTYDEAWSYINGAATGASAAASIRDGSKPA